ncbi:MAG: glutathione synthase, partial [Desulfobacterales bacterium]|nr:glutathione synthase [Desulfobacterales bacterium]
DFPLVFKYNGAGEGSSVWRVDDNRQMKRLLDQAAAWEKTGQYGFIIQQYIETGGRCLRVAVVGQTLISYWRIQQDPEIFSAAAARGAGIDHDSFPQLRAAGEEQVRRLCTRTGINLAGFDLIFPEDDPSAGPLLLEVNYYFGRRGLGGSEAFYRLLCIEIDKWLAETI